MTRGEFVGELASFFETTAGPEFLSRKLETLDWDSLKMIEFLALADEKLGAEVSPNAISKCVTVDDVVNLVGDSLS